MPSPTIIWFRRDLRVDDNAALVHAARERAMVVPLFIVDEPLIASLPSDGAAFDFQAACLGALDGALRGIGGRLIVRRGDPVAVHRALIREFRPSALHYGIDTDPAALPRDTAVRNLYEASGAAVHAHPECVVHMPDEVLSRAGTPFTVFTPFANAWKRLPHPAPLAAPARISVPRTHADSIPDARALGRRVTIDAPVARGGIEEAERRWRNVKKTVLPRYAQGRDVPAIDGTSIMSPYLRFGCISIRRMVRDVLRIAARTRGTARTGALKYLDELIWREFYHAVLHHFPRVATTSFRPTFDALPWSSDRTAFSAWRAGRTGYPLVDAGMRQLARTGWMHNRVRMVVASFLVKDLLIDWRAGDRHFASLLLDIETASNNGGWQWAASCGVDPRPMRIFNPTLQAKRYDPDGIYIRRFLPELARVPARFIHAPHRMPLDVQREAGCVIGRDYPAPIVDHAEAARAFKDAWRRVR